jgi:hypothetical protein
MAWHFGSASVLLLRWPTETDLADLGYNDIGSCCKAMARIRELVTSSSPFFQIDRYRSAWHHHASSSPSAIEVLHSHRSHERDGRVFRFDQRLGNY